MSKLGKVTQSVFGCRDAGLFTEAQMIDDVWAWTGARPWRGGQRLCQVLFLPSGQPEPSGERWSGRNVSTAGPGLCPESLTAPGQHQDDGGPRPGSTAGHSEHVLSIQLAISPLDDQFLVSFWLVFSSQ